MKNIKQMAVIAFSILFVKMTQAQLSASSMLKDLATAETKMFTGLFSGDKEYCNNSLTADYFSINADGSTAIKEMVCTDTIVSVRRTTF